MKQKTQDRYAARRMRVRPRLPTADAPRRRSPDALKRLRRSPIVAHGIPLRLRVLDIALLLLVLPFALVVGLLVAVAVFLDSPGPILYRSIRIGKSGRPFAMLKFRTMMRDSSGPPLSARGDERYTPFGRSLASSRLDELPQLWNVLRGEMRLIGPRPELEDFVRDFPAEYERILSVPPGLTGPSQLEYAWEGDVLAHAESVDRARFYRESILPLKVTIDLTYAAAHSVRGDVLILVRTALLPAVRMLRRVRAALAADGPVNQVGVAGAAMVAVAVVALIALLAAEVTSPL
jgi:lipopolysaccharide/colanic/teichoic acid biosynthesis glycosyltransferase